METSNTKILFQKKEKTKQTQIINALRALITYEI